jgi:hypothetical protein
VTFTQPSPERSYVDEWVVIAQAVAPAAITAATTPITTSMARRSRGESGSVGGVLPLLTVGGSFVLRT